MKRGYSLAPMAPSSARISSLCRRGTVRFGALLALAGAFLTIAAGMTRCSARASDPLQPPRSVSEAPEVEIRAELRSWVVAGRGRHMYLQIFAPEPYEELSGRVEYTTVALRSDYEPWSDTSGAPRVGRMSRGRILCPLPFGPAADNRLEATYTLTVEQARILQRDRIFDQPYVLVGTNSSSGLRRVMEEAGLRLPEHVLRGGGVFGEFPGVQLSPGEELPPERWASHGLRRPLEAVASTNSAAGDVR